MAHWYLDNALISDRILRHMRFLYLILCGYFCFITSTQVLAVGDGGFPSLWDSYDVSLHNQLEHTLKELGLDQAARNRKLAVTVVDITHLEEPRVASVNGDTILYAASLPKIASLMGAYVEFEQGNMVLDEATRSSITRMIRKSSNVDATSLPAGSWCLPETE